MLSVTTPAPFPPPPARFNMAAHILAAADRVPDKLALIVAGAGVEQMTYGQLKIGILTMATRLQEHGLTAGDRLLMRIGNTADFPIIFLAAIAVGIVPIPTSAALTATELDKICAQTMPKLVVHSDGISVPTADVKTIPMQVLHDIAGVPTATVILGDPNRPAYIIYTSGTSGRPTPVVHAHRAIWARQMMFEGWYDMGQNDTILHAGAFNWTYTLGTGLMDPWTIGATAIVPSDGTDVAALPGMLSDHKVSVFAAAPGVYRRMLRAAFPPLPYLRHGLSAGEKLSPDYRTDWEAKTGTTVHEAFGMSECSTFISGSPATPAPQGTSGYPQAGRRVAIIGPDGLVARGLPGTIAIHETDPGLMLGYLDAPEETAARYQDGWFLTGDIGIMDETGAITYAGRADDMMNAGGYRVSPVEVEDALTNHPAITEAAACAVQIRTDTYIIAAFYVATDVIDEDELRDFMGSRLAGYKLPRIYIVKDTLPRGANNKLLRRVLRAQWEAEHGQA